MKFKISLESFLYIILAFILASSSVYLVYINNDLYKICIVSSNIILLLLVVLRRKRNFLMSPFCISFALFIFWAQLSSIWSEYTFNYDSILVFCYVLVTMFMLTNYLYEEKQIILFLNMILVAAIILAGYIISFYGFDELTAVRMSNELLNSNAAGHIFAIVSLISLFLWFVYHKIIYLVILPFYILMLILSGSKGAIFTLGILVSVFLISKNGDNIGKKIISLFGILGLIIIMGIAITRVPTFERILGDRLTVFLQVILGTRSIYNSGNSTMMRFYFIQKGIEMFLQKPLTGFGLDMFRYYNPYGEYAHSNLFEIAVDLGIPGILLFNYPYFWIFRKIMDNRNQINKMWRAFIYAYLASVVFNSISYVFYNNLFDYLILIMIYSYIHIEFDIKKKAFITSATST